MSTTIRSISHTERWLNPSTREAAAAPGVVTAVDLAAAKISGDNIVLLYRLPNAPSHRISVVHPGATTAYEYQHLYRGVDDDQLPATPVAATDDYLPASDLLVGARNVNAHGVASGMWRTVLEAWDDYLLIVIDGDEITTAPDEDALILIESLDPISNDYRDPDPV